MKPIGCPFSRRAFLKAGLAAPALALGAPSLTGTPALSSMVKPNILLIVADQHAIDALSAHGNPHLHTPNLDRLAANGVSYRQSYCTNPVCSPSRSSLFTGRMPSETGVIDNGLPIRENIATLGEWFSQAGYESVYCGKWHMPRPYPRTIPGFRCIPGGNSGMGMTSDTMVSRACQSYLLNRPTSKKPFLLTAAFLQPHDICKIGAMMSGETLQELPVSGLDGKLPPMPANFARLEDEPGTLRTGSVEKTDHWRELDWRYYRWCYYRMVEELDAEVGRVLDALEDAGHTNNTLVVFTADHGESLGAHHKLFKNNPYEEAMRVPLIVSWPGRLAEGVQDRTRLTSGLDLLPTLCDLAGLPAPANVRGLSLRRSLEGNIGAGGQEYLAAELIGGKGRMVRSEQFKYVSFAEDSAEMLFDLRNDPGETLNLASASASAKTLAEHRRLLEQWEAKLDKAPNVEIKRSHGKEDE